MAWYVRKSVLFWLLDSVNSGVNSNFPDFLIRKEFRSKNQFGETRNVSWISMLTLNPKSYVTKNSFFNAPFENLDFSAKSGSREFQVDLIKSLGRAGGRAGGGGGDDGDADSRPRAPWPGAFPSRTQE